MIMCIVRELEILLQFDEMLSRNICTVAGNIRAPILIYFIFLLFPSPFFLLVLFFLCSCFKNLFPIIVLALRAFLGHCV